MKLNIPNHKKLWRIRVQHHIHHKDDFPQAFSVDDAMRIRTLVGAGLVAFMTWLENEIDE